MDLLTAFAEAVAAPLDVGSLVTIDGDPCVIVGYATDGDKGPVWDYRNERTGLTCWISASGARHRMVRR